MKFHFKTQRFRLFKKYTNLKPNFSTLILPLKSLRYAMLTAPIVSKTAAAYITTLTLTQPCTLSNAAQIQK